MTCIRPFTNIGKSCRSLTALPSTRESEGIIIDIVESFLEAGYGQKGSKIAVLEKASVKLNTLRFFIRLMKDSKIIDSKKYILLQEMIDEIGRMLGGWIESSAR